METPHVFILSCSGSTCLLVQACLFGKQCLASQCPRRIHDAHACSVHTKEFGCFSEENGFPPSRLLPVPQTHADSRPLFLLLESYFRCKSVSCWRVLTPLAIPEYFLKKVDKWNSFVSSWRRNSEGYWIKQNKRKNAHRKTDRESCKFQRPKHYHSMQWKLSIIPQVLVVQKSRVLRALVWRKSGWASCSELIYTTKKLGQCRVQHIRPICNKEQH